MCCRFLGYFSTWGDIADFLVAESFRVQIPLPFVVQSGRCPVVEYLGLPVRAGIRGILDLSWRRVVLRFYSSPVWIPFRSWPVRDIIVRLWPSPGLTIRWWPWAFPGQFKFHQFRWHTLGKWPSGRIGAFWVLSWIPPLWVV